MYNKRELGSRYERLAAEYLSGLGFEILDRNFRIRSGEIDLIARENGILCFIEVKYRSSLRFGRPCEAVTKKKQNNIIRTSEYWMLIRHMSRCMRRYDIIEILGDRITLIRNAYGGF